MKGMAQHTGRPTFSGTFFKFRVKSFEAVKKKQGRRTSLNEPDLRYFTLTDQTLTYCKPDQPTNAQRMVNTSGCVVTLGSPINIFDAQKMANKRYHTFLLAARDDQTHEWLAIEILSPNMADILNFACWLRYSADQESWSEAALEVVKKECEDRLTLTATTNFQIVADPKRSWCGPVSITFINRTSFEIEATVSTNPHKTKIMSCLASLSSGGGESAATREFVPVVHQQEKVSPGGHITLRASRGKNGFRLKNLCDADVILDITVMGGSVLTLNPSIITVAEEPDPTMNLGVDEPEEKENQL